MARFPLCSGNELIKVLGGSHVRLVCEGRKSVTVPDHKTIGRGLLLKILRDAELNPQEFFKILKSD